MDRNKKMKIESEDRHRAASGVSWWEKPSYLFEIGLVVLALALRWVYLNEVRTNPFFLNPTLDAGFHLQWARSILAGNIWGTDVFFRAPLYPYLLAVFHAAADGDLYVIRIFQHLIGAFSVWGVYRLTRAWHSESAAKIAGFIAAIYAASIYFEDELLLDFLLMPLMLGLLYAMSRFQKKPIGRWALITGLGAGIFAITRPNILLCWPVMAMALWQWSRSEFTNKPRVKHIALLALGTLLPVLPVTVRNAVVGDDFVLISSQGGINFYIGNNAKADGLSAAMPRPWGHTWQLTDIQRHAEEQSGRTLKPSEVSNFWLREGVRWWSEQPGAAVKLTLKKTIMLFSNMEVANNQNIRHFWDSYAKVTRYLPTKYLGFGLVGPLGLLGLFMLTRRTPLAKWTLWIMLVYAVSIIIFFVPARFRLPLLPPLFIGFGVFVIELINRYKEQNRHRLALLIGPALVLMVVSFGPWYQAAPATNAQSVFQLGNAALRTGEFDEAARQFRQTLLLHPNYENAHLNLGVVYLRQGELDLAVKEFEAELAAYPQSAKAYANLCSARGLQNRPMDAIQAGEKALQFDPENAMAILNLSRAWWAVNQPKKALALLEAAPESVKKSPAGRDALGGTYLKLNRLAQAEEVLRPLANQEVHLDPTEALGIDQQTLKEELGYTKLTEHEARANYNLGWMLVMQDNRAAAMAYFQKAIAIRPEFDEAHANIGAALISEGRPDSAMVHFQRAVELKPNEPGYIHNVGIAWLHKGDTLAAIRQFERVLELDPHFASAAAKLRELRPQSPTD
jgi:tetratricopeptide (TPR) repeat protein